MNTQPFQGQNTNENEVYALYQNLMDAWNKRNADTFANSFTEDGESIGFDGSQLIGQAEIALSLQQIFVSHFTAPYVSRVKNVRLLGPDVAILRAISGMVPPGQSDIAPALNAIHSLVALKRNGVWRTVLFQNTPAQFHGRPDLVQQMTEELQQLLK